MGVNLNKDVISESTFDFINFSIRDYVAEIRKQDPQKCWPFGLLGDPNSNEFFNSYESAESTILSCKNCLSDINCSDHTPEHTEAPNLSNIEIINIEEDRPKTTTDMVESLAVGNNMVKDLYDGSSGLTSSEINNGHENSVNEGPKNGRSEAADNSKPGADQLIIKHQKFRFLSDIYRDPASEYHAPLDEKIPENVNKTFTAETEDDLNNDFTSDELLRKRKGVEVVEVTDLKIKKKRRMVRIEQPRVDQGKKSKRVFKETIGDDLEAGPGSHLRKKLRTDDIDAQTVANHKNVGPSFSIILPKNKGALLCPRTKENAFRKQKLPCNQKLTITEATKTPNEDYEIEAVILLACRFNKADSSASGKILHDGETNAGHISVQQKMLECSNPSGNNSFTKTPVVSADGHKKSSNEKVENMFCSVQMDDDHLKGTTAAGAVPNAHNSETFMCSLNMNPADFSFPDDDNEFMRD